MSSIITILPNSVNVPAVSTTTRPVTQTALVDVNNASRKVSCLLLFREIGSRSKTVPIAIKARNPKTNSLYAD